MSTPQPSDEPEPLRYTPRFRDTLESEGILIEWDIPKPQTTVKFQPNRQNWYRRLAPLKSTPDREARVLRGLKDQDAARSRTNNIRRSLRERDPRSKWTISHRKEDDGTYGVWVTYHGVMTEEEYQEREALHDHRSKLSKLRRLRSIQKRQVQRTLTNPTLRPPVVFPDDE